MSPNHAERNAAAKDWGPSLDGERMNAHQPATSSCSDLKAHRPHKQKSSRKNVCLLRQRSVAWRPLKKDSCGCYRQLSNRNPYRLVLAAQKHFVAGRINGWNQRESEYVSVLSGIGGSALCFTA